MLRARGSMHITVKDSVQQLDYAIEIQPSQQCRDIKVCLQSKYNLPPPEFQNLMHGGREISDEETVANLELETDAVCLVSYPKSVPVRLVNWPASTPELVYAGTRPPRPAMPQVTQAYDGETVEELLSRAYEPQVTDLLKLWSCKPPGEAVERANDWQIYAAEGEEFLIGCCNPSPAMWTHNNIFVFGTFGTPSSVKINPTPNERLVSYYPCGCTPCPCTLCYTPENLSPDEIPAELALIGLPSDRWQHHMQDLARRRVLAWLTPCQWIWFLYVAVSTITCVGWLLPTRLLLDVDNHCLRCWLSNFNAELDPLGAWVKFQVIKQNYEEEHYMCIAVTPLESERLKSEPIFLQGKGRLPNVTDISDDNPAYCPADIGRVI